MNNLEMSQKQLDAYGLLTDMTTNEVLYGGGARGGKSYFGCQWVILQCFSKPGSTWLIGRDTLLSLKQSTLLELFKVMNVLKIEKEMYHYRQDQQMIKFKNGSIIFIKGLTYQPSDPEFNWLGSLTLTGYFIDEAQEVHENAIKILRGRTSNLSGKDEKGTTNWSTVPKALYTCNPDKGWVYRQFYQPYKDGTLDVTRKFIPALVIDNPFIPTEDKKSYILNLKKSDKITVQRLLYGNFDYDETRGRIFEFDALHDMFTNPDSAGDKYITCDISRGGGDRTFIMLWEGYTVRYILHWSDQNADFAMKKIKELCSTYKIPMSRVLIDENGIGGGCVDNLKCRGFIGNRKPISPFSKKFRPELQRNYHDLRCQCLMGIAKLVNERKICILDETIKKDIVDELDLICHTNLDKDEAIRLTTKEDMRKSLPDQRSSDVSDCFYMRAWFDLFLTDQQLSDIERVYNPHVDEDIFGHKMTVVTGIDEFLASVNTKKTAYLAKMDTDIF